MKLVPGKFVSTKPATELDMKEVPRMGQIMIRDKNVMDII